MSPTRLRNALGLASVVAFVALCICVGLDLFSYFSVHRDVITALTGAFSGCGVGYVACRVGDDIIVRITGRLDRVEASQREIRHKLAALPDVVDDQVEARVAQTKIDALRDLAQTTNGYAKTRLRSVNE